MELLQTLAVRTFHCGRLSSETVSKSGAPRLHRQPARFCHFMRSSEFSRIRSHRPDDLRGRILLPCGIIKRKISKIIQRIIQEFLDLRRLNLRIIWQSVVNEVNLLNEYPGRLQSIGSGSLSIFSIMSNADGEDRVTRFEFFWWFNGSMGKLRNAGLEPESESGPQSFGRTRRLVERD